MIRDGQELFIEGQIAEMINDASIDRIIAFDENKKIIAWNTSCADLTGITRDEAIGKQFFDLFNDAAADDHIVKAVNGALKGFRMFVPSDKGSLLEGYHESHFIPLKNDHNVIAGVLCLMHDVAHRVKAENELKSLNKSLAKKNKELKEKNAELLSFSQVTGHDLKEPLRKIYTFIEMILAKDEQNLSETSRSHFKRVQASVQRMGILTDDLLNFSLLGLNNKEEAAAINLNHILKMVMNDFNATIREKNAIIISTSLPVVKGFRSLLADLFMHLISNGLKFQKDNEPRISIAARLVKGEEIANQDIQPDADYWDITFEDNGIGFEQKYAERIFQLFQRMHNQDSYSGSGVGLTVCRKIMNLHNGFITAESHINEGSRFHCYFPALKE